MAEALGIASALIAIVTATIQTSQILYDTIQSFRSHQRSVQQLLDELSALKEVLQSLDTHIQIEDDANLASLKTPLLQCRRACADFDTLMTECTKYSGRPRTSFRGWVKVRYMESDIHGFTSMLAGYKSTIAIALGDANLSVTRRDISCIVRANDTRQSLCYGHHSAAWGVQGHDSQHDTRPRGSPRRY